ncbi:NADPH-dependent FMN reductase [Ammoniphilus resinae]|uniref:Chromate reductase n=1 Tax=Ammoniphilus resinae TaxID=861532 RepID=A0ABS4GKB9_9BACL|nr:NAD(P)H-dependent oxidoreductase [Ammoniphilus resinae]MBP1930703.1 chromate reductase [Ammoniphilus resinae]
MSKIHIVGICGSLRKNSQNRGLLRAFEQELPDHVKFTLADLSEIPFFNQDQENPYPDAVLKLKELVNSADALIISTPEYNLSYPGFLKNALEWLSRRTLQAKLAGKPVALIGAAAISVNVSQSHLRDVMFALNMKVLGRPIVHVGNSRTKFDEEGNLTDLVTKDLLVQLKDALIDAVKG